MDADIAYADCRLDAWASWVKGGMSAWPSMTMLGRVIEQGLSGAAQAGVPLVGMPDEVLATDRAVARLDVYERKVVIVYYLTYADSEIKAARCGVSRATFWRRVTRAQKRIYEYLHDETRSDNYRADWSVPSLRTA